MQLTIGNASGIMSAFIYPIQDAPRYIRGHGVSLSMVGLGVLIYALLWYWYRRENARREAGYVNDKFSGLSEEDLKELGDESPHFRYTI